MKKNILIIQGHPDMAAVHFGHLLARQYKSAALQAGHEVKEIMIARLRFPLLRSKREFDHGTPTRVIKAAQDSIEWADHILIFYPLWLGSMPALLKGFLEQVFRPGFVGGEGEGGMPGGQKLGGRTAHIVITMGMPAFIYRWYYRAHCLKNLKRNILGFCGIKTIEESLIGMVEAKNDAARKKWLDRMASFGARAA